MSTFVAGGSGFVGQEVLRALGPADAPVLALARSDASAAIVEELGARAVRGDLAEGGAWQEELRRCDVVVHAAQPPTFGGRITPERARDYTERRLAIDRALLDPLDSRRVRRVVYVAGTSFYGHQGRRPVDEDATPRPRGWGRPLAPALARTDADLARGLPLVFAFPGWVYGLGSWYLRYVLRPVSRGRPLYRIGLRRRWTSPVHVRDCGAAIAHLARVGVPGSRTFVVDDRPVLSDELARATARALCTTVRFRTLPAWVARTRVGELITESALCDSVLDNRRLRQTGFSLAYPTVEEGVAEVVAAWRSEGGHAE